MKRFQFYYLFAFATLGLSITGCSDDNDENNQITITIEEPVNGSTIAMADCGNVHIHVQVVASDENHELEIVLYPEGDINDKIIDYDAHDHDQTIEFEQNIDLCSYAAGTCFHLEVAACLGHDCAERATADAEFCLQ